jgi:hypothetical protein
VNRRGKPKAGSGRFRRLANEVAKEYVKKGMSKKKAEQVGKAVAAKIGMKKYGKRAMVEAAVKGRKRKKK